MRVFVDRGELRLAVVRHGTTPRPWVDALHGLGQAMDPLPASGMPTFSRDDIVAARADLIKLVNDRDHVHARERQTGFLVAPLNPELGTSALAKIASITQKAG